MPQAEQHQRGPLKTVEWTSGDGLPPERLVVLCHGFGASGTDLVGIGEAFGNDGPPTRWIFPAAPLAPADMADWGGRAWWPLRLSEMAQELALANFDARPVIEKLAVQEPEGLSDARDALAETVELARSEYEDLPWVLGGFSQGAMLTSDVAARRILTPSGLMLFSGCPIGVTAWGKDGPIALPAVVSHGMSDQVLPFVAGELLSQKLTDPLGCDVTFLPFGGGHEIPSMALSGLQTLMNGLAADS